jgi:hypothetical protein
MNSIEDEMRWIACEGLISHAAKVYSAELDSSVDYGGFMTIGADEILCTADEKIASRREQLQWTKWRYLAWACSPGDLTFSGCIRFLVKDCADEDPDPVTVEEVMAVLKGEKWPT